MQKLKLDLDSLEVASFEVSTEETATRGTVDGQILPLLIFTRAVYVGYQLGQAAAG